VFSKDGKDRNERKTGPKKPKIETNGWYWRSWAFLHPAVELKIVL